MSQKSIATAFGKYTHRKHFLLWEQLTRWQQYNISKEDLQHYTPTSMAFSADPLSSSKVRQIMTYQLRRRQRKNKRN